METFGKYSKKIETVQKLKFLFCIMYKFHNSYFVIWGFVYFIYIYIYIYIYCFFILYLFIYIYIFYILYIFVFCIFYIFCIFCILYLLYIYTYTCRSLTRVGPLHVYEGGEWVNGHVGGAESDVSLQSLVPCSEERTLSSAYRHGPLRKGGVAVALGLKSVWGGK